MCDSTKPDVLRLEVYQSDWMPGYAAFLDDGSIAEDAKAHIALNLSCFMACVESGELEKADLPYAIAETIMHEAMHALQAWAGAEFSEDRIEDMLARYREKYNPHGPRYAKCEPRQEPGTALYAPAEDKVVADLRVTLELQKSENARLRQAASAARCTALEATLCLYRKPCAHCGDLLCDEKCKAACGAKFNNVTPLTAEPFAPESDEES